MPNQTLYQVAAPGGGIKLVNVTPVLTVHANYAAGDYVGTSADAMTFSDCARIDGGSGMIMGAALVDAALQSISGELWLFDTEPTPPNDSAAWTITDAHAANLVGVIPISTYYASAANSVGQSDILQIPFKCAAGSRDLYGCFVTRGAPTYASGDLTFRLKVLQF